MTLYEIDQCIKELESIVDYFPNVKSKLNYLRADRSEKIRAMIESVEI